MSGVAGRQFFDNDESEDDRRKNPLGTALGWIHHYLESKNGGYLIGLRRSHFSLGSYPGSISLQITHSLDALVGD